MTARKVFNYHNLDESAITTNLNYFAKNISACGCLFFKVVDNNINLLLIKYDSKDWSKLDDFGGKIDLEDKSVNVTIFRETAEETNFIIDLEAEISKFSNVTYHYTEKSKYYFVLIEVDNDFYPDTEVFGSIETTDNIGRSIKWYNYKDVKNKLAWRLHYCKSLHEMFDKIISC